MQRYLNFDVNAIIGLQLGSEGKGALAGYLGKRNKPKVVMSNFSPNTGHTFRDGANKLVRRMIPIGAYTSPACQFVLIGPGSIIDLDHFYNEIGELPNHVEVIVHPAAAVVTEDHLEIEKSFARIGSTMKGSAAAAISRMIRDPLSNPTMGQFSGEDWTYRGFKIDAKEYNRILYHALERNWPIQIEGCQGYSLSMYHGFYPYVTSRDTTIHQLLADVSFPANNPVRVYGCARTYPIRVANRPEGTSGPCYDDQREISWGDLGVEPELTTVTKLPRRIFTFSDQQIREACRINGCKYLYVSFTDYPLIGGVESFIDRIERESGAEVVFTSDGPDLTDMKERRPGH